MFDAINLPSRPALIDPKGSNKSSTGEIDLLYIENLLRRLHLPILRLVLPAKSYCNRGTREFHIREYDGAKYTNKFPQAQTNGWA